MNWLHWLGIELVCAWVWVQTLEDPNETVDRGKKHKITGESSNPG